MGCLDCSGVDGRTINKNRTRRIKMKMLIAKVLGALMLTTTIARGEVFSGTYVADKARTLSGALFTENEIHGVVSLKIGKANGKGLFKVSGTVITCDGKKHAIKAGNITLSADGLTYSGLTIKDYGALTLRLWANGFQGDVANGWKMETATIDSMPQGTLTFTVSPYPGSIDGRQIIRTEYLPRGLSFTSMGTKFILPKAGSVKYKKGALTVSSGGEANPSGLKLSYNAKSGTFKGSFNIYALDRGKLTKFAAKLTGVTVEGYGFGDVTFKKLIFNPPVKAYIY